MVSKFLIIGVMKGGTSSLQKYLENQGHKVIRNSQLFTRDDGPDVYNRKYKDYTPILILRDPVERAWADYHHRLRRDLIPGDAEYQDYCKWNSKYFKNYLSVGELNIIEISKYNQWIDIWQDIPLELYYLEEQQKLEGFPQENKGLYPKISDEDRKFTEKLLNEI